MLYTMIKIDTQLLEYIILIIVYKNVKYGTYFIFNDASHHK